MAGPNPYSQLWRWEVQKTLSQTLALDGAGAPGTTPGMEIGRIDGVASTPYIDFHSGATLTDFDTRLLATGGTGTAGQGSLTFYGAALLPGGVTGVTNLGSATSRWGTIYTSDLSLKNDVGDWTVVEGADDLFITNNRTGKRYKFALIEVA